MKKYLSLVFIALLFFMFGCKGDTGPAGATGATGAPGTPGDSIVATFFQKGIYPSGSYTGVTDSYIGSDSFQSNNYGNQTSLYIGYYKLQIISPPIYFTSKERGILKFDLSILSGQNITLKNASLILYCNNITPSVASLNITPYKLTYDFVENEATWMNRDNSNAWTNPGGDYDATPIGSKIIVSTIDSYIEFKLDTATVKNWIDSPSTNYGLILIADEENNTTSTYAGFLSSDYPDINKRPKLVVNYTIN